MSRSFCGKRYKFRFARHVPLSTSAAAPHSGILSTISVAARAYLIQPRFHVEADDSRVGVRLPTGTGCRSRERTRHVRPASVAMALREAWIVLQIAVGERGGLFMKATSSEIAAGRVGDMRRR